MTFMKRFMAVSAMLAGISLLPALAATPASAKSCVMAGGEATMVTGDLARFMANAALKNSIKDRGYTASGAVNMKCNDPSPLVYCIARQRACK